MRTRPLYLTVTLALLGACTADIPAPTAIEFAAIAPRAAKGGNGPKGTSNRIKPSDNGKKPGTGGSGSSTLELSALLGVDGTTTIEASTGSLEDETTNGTLTKMQLKLFLDSVITLNYTGLAAGYWSTTDTRLARGDSVQGKGTIKPVAGKGTDNVTVATAVHLRPDIAVRSLEAADPVIRDIPHTILAVIEERNLDRGARGDCILSINGVDVDQATGIWVDAGATVACQFAHTFNMLGDQSVSVRVANVRPGDWDVANNAATITVTVVRPVFTVARGWADVREEHAQYLTSTDTQHFGASDLHHRIQEEHHTLVRMDAFDAVVRPNPFQSASAVIYKDGQEVHRKEAMPLVFEGESISGENRHTCYAAFDGHDLARACVWDGPGGSGTRFYYEKRNGFTIYYGYDIYCLFGFCNTYSSPSSHYQYGGGHAFGFTSGSEAKVHVTWHDGIGDPHVGEATIATLTNTPINHHTQSCRTPKTLKELGKFLQICDWTDNTGYVIYGRTDW